MNRRGFWLRGALGGIVIGGSILNAFLAVLGDNGYWIFLAVFIPIGLAVVLRDFWETRQIMRELESIRRRVEWTEKHGQPPTML